LIGAGVGIAVLVALAWMARANSRLHTEVGEIRTELEQAQSVAEQNLEAFNRVDELNRICVNDRAVDKQQNAVTVAQLNADMISVSSRAQQVRVMREEIFRDPTCKELASIDIGARCPAWADELRFSAQAINPNPNSRGAGGGANAASGRVLQDLPAGVPVH
jgi:hypothetical protein